MKTRMIIGVAAAALLFGALLGPATGAQRGASTKVTMKHVGGGEFSGVVSSENEKLCAAERSVTVYRKKSGKDESVVSATALSQNGKWRWSAQTGFLNGTFYAKAKKTSNCDADKSPEVKI